MRVGRCGNGMSAMRFLCAAAVAAVIIVPAFAVIVVPAVAESAELVMFESPGCGWCAKWDREIRPVYAKSAEGRVLPLRSILGRVPPPGDFVLERPVRFTPTFVVVDAGREVARITGYPGEGAFWELLGTIVHDLKARVAVSCDKKGESSC